MSESATPSRGGLGEVAWLFLRLGSTAFGGPAAHIALMEDEVVRRRAWLSRQEFLDLIAAANLIPGPNSTELAIHIGYRRAGWPGLVVAGLCFIVPAMILVTIIAWAYVRFGTLPSLHGLLAGVKPVIIAVVLQALWGLARTACKSLPLGLLGLAALVASLLGVHELLVLFGAALLTLIVHFARRLRGPGPSLILPLALPLPALKPALPAVAAAVPVGLSTMFFFFLKVGSVLFGSGYVLLAFLRADLVERWHWLSEAQLLDAIAVGQITPGPVFTTATFIGYLLGGLPSALLATLGIFLPAFVFVAISAPFLPRLRQSPVAAAALDGLNVASLALMLAAAWFLARTTITSWPPLAITMVSAILLIRFRVNSAWLVLGGAAIGLVFPLI